MKVPKARQLSEHDWFIQLRLKDENGVTRSIPVHGETEAKCKAEAAAIKYGLKDTPAKSTVTLRQAIEKYLEDRERVMSPSTVANYRSYLRTRFQSVMDRPAATVNWQKVVNDELKSVSPKTVKNMWGICAPALKEYGIEPTVKLPPVVRKERTWLTPKQIVVFVNAVYGKSFEIAALLALMGLRRSEILGLTWDNVDLEKNIIRIHGAVVYDKDYRFNYKDTNKTSSSRRTIPIMIPRLAEALSAVENKSGPVVKTNPTTLYSQVNELCEKEGLPLVGVHGLRHSFASLGYHLKMSEMEVMRLGGWSDFSTVRRIYTHLADEDAANAATKMRDFFSNC